MKSSKKNLIFVFLMMLSISCGSSTNLDVPTDTNPFIEIVDPGSGASGDEISIKGVGFSDAAPNNIIILGEEIMVATSYDILDPPEGSAIEVIKFNVPDGMTAGDYNLLVMVHEVVSNVETFTVTSPAAMTDEEFEVMTIHVSKGDTIKDKLFSGTQWVETTSH